MTTQRQTVTIANGASLSGEIDCAGLDVIGLVMPAAWTAADISFAVASREDLAGNAETFLPLYDDAGTELTLEADASRFVALRPDISPLTRGPWRIKLRSGLVGAAVNQGAARTIGVILGKAN